MKEIISCGVHRTVCFDGNGQKRVSSWNVGVCRISWLQPVQPPHRPRALRIAASVLISVTSQASNFPACHGIWVALSGRLPSQRMRPTGSLTAGTPVDTKPRATKSFNCWWLGVLLGARLQTTLCTCRWPARARSWREWQASTSTPQRQVWRTPRFFIITLLRRGWRSYVIVRSVILSVSRITDDCDKGTSTTRGRHGQGVTL